MEQSSPLDVFICSVEHGGALTLCRAPHGPACGLGKAEGHPRRTPRKSQQGEFSEGDWSLPVTLL